MKEVYRVVNDIFVSQDDALIAKKYAYAEDMEGHHLVFEPCVLFDSLDEWASSSILRAGFVRKMRNIGIDVISLKYGKKYTVRGKEYLTILRYCGYSGKGSINVTPYAFVYDNATTPYLMFFSKKEIEDSFVEVPDDPGPIETERVG